MTFLPSHLCRPSHTVHQSYIQSSHHTKHIIPNTSTRHTTYCSLCRYETTGSWSQRAFLFIYFSGLLGAPLLFSFILSASP
ncbi:MAG: hypothetical protein J3R72DRAFT_528752 [Linnemannia gamsii]|nr:MAG: hypothetical protein J3R72DRAFT_528752 [Linnemannia gamsii]